MTNRTEPTTAATTDNGDAPDTGQPVHVAMARAAADIGAVAKNLKNAEAGYAARSIDDVLDAVHDPLTKHGIVILPTVVRSEYRDVAVGRNQTRMREASLTIRWRFVGPLGDYVEATTCGEALDTGDKATNKAQSAALKYALLHVFTIPVSSGDRESDEASPERAVEPPPVEMATHEQIDRIAALGKSLKEAGGDPGRWPVVLGVRLMRNKAVVATFDMAEGVIEDLTAKVAAIAERVNGPLGEGETHCTACGAVVGAEDAVAFDDDGNVTVCRACMAEPTHVEA